MSDLNMEALTLSSKGAELVYGEAWKMEVERHEETINEMGYKNESQEVKEWLVWHLLKG